VQDHRIPLCVDLDALIRPRLPLEAALALVRAHPLRLFVLLAWLLRGPAFLRRRLEARAAPNAADLPYETRLLDELRQPANGRRRILLARWNPAFAAAVAAHVGGFDDVLVVEAGAGRAELLQQRFGARGYDYVGRGADDLPAWRLARRAVVVNAPARVARQAQAQGNVETVIDPRPARRRAWIRALRPHQWAKNLLVFVPVLGAHLLLQPEAMLRAAAAFACFCLCASGTYVLNDLLDLGADRQHARKRTRPFAAGDLPAGGGLAAAALLVAAAFLVATWLSPRFTLVLSGYFAATLVYSLFLKRIAVIDVMTLAALYSTRIIGGAVAVPVEASFWLLAFSTFLFLSLAMVKRYTELRGLLDGGHASAAGRGYTVADLPLIESLGTSSGYLSVLVLAFYINSTASEALYRHPQVLWALTPAFLYWISRVWFVARRGQMHDDPVVFALTDPASYVVAAVLVGVVVVAI
jgi:4-hydroxybenzoate polyprenyltransferase